MLNNDVLIDNGLKYSGIVTVTVKQGQKIIKTNVIKNAGTELLFKTLCRCLCGDTDAVKTMPFYIDAGVIECEKFVSKVVYMSPISQRVPNYTSDKWSAVFTATFVYSQMLSNSITSLALKTLDGEILATVTGNSGDFALTDTATLLVKWDMSFNN